MASSIFPVASRSARMAASMFAIKPTAGCKCSIAPVSSSRNGAGSARNPASSAAASPPGRASAARSSSHWIATAISSPRKARSAGFKNSRPTADRCSIGAAARTNPADLVGSSGKSSRHCADRSACVSICKADCGSRRSAGGCSSLPRKVSCCAPSASSKEARRDNSERRTAPRSIPRDFYMWSIPPTSPKTTKSSQSVVSQSPRSSPPSSPAPARTPLPPLRGPR